METLIIDKVSYSISDGKFFRDNPSKVLAESYEATGRFGMVTKYRVKEGMSIPDTLKQIETPNFIGHGITDISAGVSVIIKETAITQADEPNIIQGIKDTEQEITKKRRSKKRRAIDFEEGGEKPLLYFEDVLRNNNPDLNDDEIKAFLWYMNQQGNTYRGKWLDFFNPLIISQEQEAAYVQGWVESGVLFYFRSDLLPAFIYFSENLYERKIALDRDKQDIISLYGQTAFDTQKTKLEEAFSEVYNNRLKLDNPEVDNRLHLKPYSEFAKTTKVKNWNIHNETGEPAKFYVIESAAEKTFGEINWYSKKTSVSHWDSKSKESEELSINDAFRYWLKQDNNRPSIPHNFNWEDIFRYYLDKKAVKNIDPTVLARNRALAKQAGEELFGRFLAEIILESDRVRIETLWNEKFNGSRGLRTDKIPIAFDVALSYPGDDPMEIKPEKREGVAFASIRGSSLNAYQVGVGKTWSAIFTIAQFLDSEHCKRPVVIVPNQVYRQFMSEIKGILPHRKINDLYNLGKDYIDQLLDESGNLMQVDQGSISMLTYEGFERIGFLESTAQDLMSRLQDALMQIQEFNTETAAQEKALTRKTFKLEGLIGKALMKTTTNIEDIGFDFVCFDEAHALKNIFAQVKAKSDSEGKKEKKMYEITGSSSTRGIKAYMLCSYIQSKNNGRNILLLTATPFTNSPLEVYSMLSLVAYPYLQQMGLNNINDFFDNYCHMSYELVINSKLQPIRKQIFKAFDNLVSLQKLVYRFMLHKEAGKEDANGNIISLVRPDKWVLPYKGRFDENRVFIPAGENEFVDTILPLSEQQKLMMVDIISYVEGVISYEELSSKGTVIVEEEEEGVSDGKEVKIKQEVEELDFDSLDTDEKAGVRTLRGINFARSLALSPYLYEFSGLGKPDYKSYIKTSPKLEFTMGCVKSVKQWHEKNKEAVSSQVIYMDRGKAHFDLIKEYLIEEIGYKPHEIGIIRSGKEGNAQHKEAVKNAFNGIEFDEKTKMYNDIPDADRIKIIIGTSSIREGMNLQRHGTVLYNCFVDWNPTDQIQLEGRVWRQGNIYKNIRIVIPQMSDSMDIFMFQKLEEKTERVNSIWNFDGHSNVLKVEELDPQEQKLALVTNPRVIAELRAEDEITRMEEEIASLESVFQTAENIIGFFDTRSKFEEQLRKVIELVDPDKKLETIEQLVKHFEKMLSSGKNSKDQEINDILSSKNFSTYEYDFVDYNKHLSTGYSFGRMKGSIAMLKKARTSFMDRYNISDNKESMEDFIAEIKKKAERIKEEKTTLQSDDYITQKAKEIEIERAERNIIFASVTDRIAEFETLNYLLGFKRDKNINGAQAFIYEDIEGCPPMSGDQIDASEDGIRKLERCISNIPQTKALHVNDLGEYTPDRLKLHQRIKNVSKKGATCARAQDKPIAIITGGVPGSGKTTFLKHYAPWLQKENIYKVDADEIRMQLPEYKGWNASATHLETQDIYRGILKELSEGQPCRFDILWDGTMNKAKNYLPLIGDLKKLGYEVYVIFVEVSPAVSRKRVIERYKKTGRYVPLEVVDEANNIGKAGFDIVKSKADGWILVNGETAEIEESHGKPIPEDRGYFERKATDKDLNRKKLLLRVKAQKMRLRILALK